MSKKITRHQHETSEGVKITATLPAGRCLISIRERVEISEWLKSITGSSPMPVGSEFSKGAVITGIEYRKPFEIGMNQCTIPLPPPIQYIEVKITPAEKPPTKNITVKISDGQLIPLSLP